MQLDDQYWSSRYKNGTAAWDIGQVAPPLKKYIEQLKNKEVKILIPGCGNSYEAEYLMQTGFSNITLIDVSSILCENLKKKFAVNFSAGINIICGDFFEHKGAYDIVIEQTFFCAIDPSLRKKYTDKMEELLVPGGKLAGLFFNRQFESSPPFGGNEKEYKELFRQQFKIEIMEECYNSIEPRAGSELFVKLVK